MPDGRPRCASFGAMRSTELPPHKTATYVLPRWKVVYVSVPKAACTSLKWLMADLQHERHEDFHSALSHETGRSMTVHRRSLWQHTPMLHQLPWSELEQITPENGWFVFAVVRHPSARLWSAWQSKFLLQEPRFAKLYPEAPWPRVPATTSDVVEDFHLFTRALDEDPPQRVFSDRHFMSQARLLRVDSTPYSRIYQTTEIPQLLDDLEKHLRPQGLEQMPELLRINETPLRPIEPLFTPEVTQTISRCYAADFEHFGYTSPVPDGLDQAGEYPASVLSEVGRLVDRSERIGDLVGVAVGWRDKQRETSKRLAALERRQQRTARARRAAREQVSSLKQQVAREREARIAAESRSVGGLFIARSRRRAGRTLRRLGLRR